MDIIERYESFIKELREHPERFEKKPLSAEHAMKFSAYCEGIEVVYGREIADVVRSWNTDFFPEYFTNAQVKRIKVVGEGLIFDIAEMADIDGNFGMLSDINMRRIVRKVTSSSDEPLPVKDFLVLFDPNVRSTEGFAEVYIPF